MDHRTAYITGASSGIGACLAKALAARGVQVGLAARRADCLQELADEIVRNGGRARVYPVDVSDPEAVIASVKLAERDLEGLDLVVANAGVGKSRWSGKLKWEDCVGILSVNVVGATATIVAAIEGMVARQRGHLVGISSLAAYRGLPRNATYSASKAYLSTFLEALRIDLRRTAISVTDIRPGFVRTAMTEDMPKTPFLVKPEDAAAEILGAIDRRQHVYGFPLPLAAAVRSISALPNPLYDRLAARVM